MRKQKLLPLVLGSTTLFGLSGCEGSPGGETQKYQRGRGLLLLEQRPPLPRAALRRLHRRLEQGRQLEGAGRQERRRDNLDLGPVQDRVPD